MQMAFTNKQISFILFGTIVGFGVMGMPSVAAQDVGTGYWISILAATAVAILVTLGITYLGYTYKGRVIYEYGDSLVGKPINIAFMVCYIVYFFVALTIITRISSAVIRYTILHETPIWALNLTLLAVVAYTISKGIKTLVKMAVLFGIAVIFVALTSHLLVFSQGETLHLQPLIAPVGIDSYLKSTLKMLLPFLGMEILLIIPFGQKNNKKIFLYTSLTILFIGLFYIFVVMTCISVMGADTIIYYRDSILATIRRIQIDQLGILKRLDGLAMIGWVMAIYISLSLLAYGSVSIISKICPGRSINTPKYNIIVIATCMAAFIGSLILPSCEIAYDILNYNAMLGILTVVIIPVLYIIMTKVKGYDKKNN